MLWIGIVITGQAFQACPKEHAPAVVIGIMPGVAAWGTLLMKQSLQVAGMAFDEKLFPAFRQKDNWLHGAFALSEGFIFTSMILAAATVALIERMFHQAAAWCFTAAGLCALGFMHSYKFIKADTAQDLLQPFRSPSFASWQWVIGYTVMGLFFLAAKWITKPSESGH